MADQAILREYLIALGFKVDKVAQTKFKTEIVNLDKTVSRLGKGLVGVALGAQAMVGIFANQMEKLYYASRRIGTTAGNLKALEYGFSQVGGSGEAMRSALEGMARSIRSNPGLIGLLQKLGVEVKGRDMSDVFKDLMHQLAKMPTYIGEKYAALFGMDADTFYQAKQNMAELEKFAQRRKDMAAEMGIDMDKAAEAGKEYAQSWREILARADLFKDALSLALLPLMRDMATVTNEVLKDWTSIASKPGDFWNRMKEGLFGSKREGVVLNKETRDRLGIEPPLLDDPKTSLGPGAYKDVGNTLRGYYEHAMRLSGSKRYASAGSGAGRGYVNPDMPGGSAGSGVPGPSSDLFARLEADYGLPAGLLDRIWKKESGRGRNMLSASGAKGHFQFMDATAAQYGVTDPNDLENSATGAAKYMKYLLAKYGGNQQKATAAYHSGEGTVNAALAKDAELGGGWLSYMGPKGRDYANTVPTVQQTNSITIYGSSDPSKAAAAIGEEMRTNNADLVRNLQPRVQ